jgi:hypothetical protein
MAVVSTIIADALTEIGVLAAGETMTAGDAALGLRRLQNQIDAWAADRLTLSVQTRTTFPLASGSTVVTIGAAGAQVTMDRPMWINTLAYLIPSTNPAVEVPIGLMDEDAYAAISIKTLSSAYPTQAFYQTNLTNALGTLTFWPQVSQTVTIAMYSPQAVGVPAGLTSVLVGPPGYQDAFLYALALRLCAPFGVSPPPMLSAMATSALMTMKRPNVRPGILGVDPALTAFARAGTYNVLSDQGG